MKVTVITPSFNQGRFIGRTLQSVAIQTGAAIEHVVIDGASTDDTLSVLKSFIPAVRWISEQDKGQADAVNKGIRATDGEIVGWLNSDDVYYAGAVARVADFFKANPAIDVAYGMADHIDVADRPLESYPTEPWNFERLKERCFICQPALFFRRRLVEQYGMLDDTLNYCMDYEYWLRLGKAGVRFAYLDGSLAGSRMYAENKTLGARVKVHREINDMLKKTLGRVPDRWLFNYAHVVVEDRLGRRDASRRVVLEIAARSIAAALRWNRSVSVEMGKTIDGWIFAGARQLLRRALFNR
jgi:glycosyltransferase involved in cell wall biosynthesis